MTGNTHTSIGIAASFALLQPDTVPECLCALIGGLVGSVISDIDSEGKKGSFDHSDDPYAWQLVAFFLIAIIFIMSLDYLAGNGAVDYIRNHFEPPLWISAGVFIMLCVLGAKTPHRTFMHSILAGLLFSGCLWFFCRPIVPAFIIGFSSHLLLDFLNKTTVQYFWPIPVRIGLNKYPSDGQCNDILGALGTVISIYLVSFFLIKCFASSVLFDKILSFFYMPVSINGLMTVPMYVIYFVAINILTFIVYWVDSIILSKGILFYHFPMDSRLNEAQYYENVNRVFTMAEFMRTLYLPLDFCGGVIGKIIFAFFYIRESISKGKDANFNLYILPLCVLGSWIAIFFTFVQPRSQSIVQFLMQLNIKGIPLLYIIGGVFIILNLITYFVFANGKRMKKDVTFLEIGYLLLGFVGGATGGYLAMQITGHHKNASMLSYTYPIMITMHAIIITCIIYSLYYM